MGCHGCIACPRGLAPVACMAAWRLSLFPVHWLLRGQALCSEDAPSGLAGLCGHVLAWEEACLPCGCFRGNDEPFGAGSPWGADAWSPGNGARAMPGSERFFPGQGRNWGGASVPWLMAFKQRVSCCVFSLGEGNYCGRGGVGAVWWRLNHEGFKRPSYLECNY